MDPMQGVLQQDILPESIMKHVLSTLTFTPPVY